MVREYHTIGKIHQLYVQFSNLNQEQTDREYDWTSEITNRQTKALGNLAKDLDSRKETDDQSSVFKQNHQPLPHSTYARQLNGTFTPEVT